MGVPHGLAMGNCMSDAERATGIGPADIPRSLGTDEAEAVFAAMQARLDEIMKLPIVRDDAVARGLLDDMARAGAMDDIVVLLDELDARVTLLLRRKGEPAPSAADRRERASRTLLRL